MRMLGRVLRVSSEVLPESEGCGQVPKECRTEIGPSSTTATTYAADCEQYLVLFLQDLVDDHIVIRVLIVLDLYSRASYFALSKIRVTTPNRCSGNTAEPKMLIEQSPSAQSSCLHCFRTTQYEVINWLSPRLVGLLPSAAWPRACPLRLVEASTTIKFLFHVMLIRKRIVASYH